MTGACGLLWEAAGRPLVAHPKAGPPTATPGAVCTWCAGDAAFSVDIHRWGGGKSGTFTGWHTLRRRDSTRLCAACLWVSAGRPPDTMRGWTVLWRADGNVGPTADKVAAALRLPGVQLTARNNSDGVVGTLLDPPRHAVALRRRDIR